MTGLLNFILKISDRTEIGNLDPHLYSGIFSTVLPTLLLHTNEYYW